jgi:hypothetical protein
MDLPSLSTFSDLSSNLIVPDVAIIKTIPFGVKVEQIMEHIYKHNIHGLSSQC